MTNTVLALYRLSRYSLLGSALLTVNVLNNSSPPH